MKIIINNNKFNKILIQQIKLYWKKEIYITVYYEIIMLMHNLLNFELHINFIQKWILDLYFETFK